ncbi:MAG: hypothetical protein AMXMBFR82_02680 [Candidatus Hydrogenedentota bacterium]
MKTVLTVVGVTLAVVIVAVAAVYGWMLVSTPPPSDKLPTPPPKTARTAPSTPPATPPPSAQGSASQSEGRVSQTPNALAPPSSRNLVHPAAPPPTQVADAQTGGSTSTPVAEALPPVTPESDAPLGESAVVPDTMEAKLNALQFGLTDDEVRAIMGAEGTPADDVIEYMPQGWYALRWREADGASITATFNEYNTLVHLAPFKVPGAFEWMNANVPYSIVTWLNDNLENTNLPVRVPAVQVGAVSQSQFQFQAGLVTQDGQVAGSIAGNYYLGDGQTTYIPNDPQPYVRAMEGSYQFYAPNGAQVADTFGVTEY